MFIHPDGGPGGWNEVYMRYTLSTFIDRTSEDITDNIYQATAINNKWTRSDMKEDNI